VKTQVIFFDIGHTLVTGADQSPRRLLASRLDLTEKEARRVGQLIMTHICDESDQLVGALKELLPARDPNRIRDVVETVWMEQTLCVKEIRGATSLASSLKSQGYRLGIISNIWHPFYQGFCRTCPALLDLMDYKILSYRIGLKKPSLDLYQRAVMETGEAASSCWMVGDTYELDMAPARKIGMKTLWVLCRPEKERPLLAQLLRGEIPSPDWVVESIEEILPFFGLRNMEE
jgi:FMN phosphatase YigB (HAD superfamily)